MDSNYVQNNLITTLFKSKVKIKDKIYFIQIIQVNLTLDLLFKNGERVHVPRNSPFEAYSSVVFHMFTRLYNHHHYFQSFFIPPQKNPCAHWESSPTLFPVTTNGLSASMDLPILDTPYKWNHTICTF